MKRTAVRGWWVLGPILLIIVTALRSKTRTTPLIKTHEGYVQGLYSKSRNGSNFMSFYGIPYAKPPIGRLRFLPPQKVIPWEGVLDATKVTPDCFQFDGMVFQEMIGAEDCLHLNIFTHGTNRTAPVLVFIPGGAFMSGGASYYGPDYFMDHEIVLVTFNYRVGPFGFLNLGMKEVSGNQGLKDQVQVLRWVQRNIRYFGGDNNRVTLFGQSAGASSVHFHMLASNHLFNRAVMHSGSAFCPWSFTTKGSSPSREYVSKLKCPTNSTQELLHCLNYYDAAKVVSLQRSMTQLDLQKDLLLPSIETSKFGYITQHPMQMKVNRSIPLLTLFNPGEGSFRTARLDALPDASVRKFKANWRESLMKFLAFDNFDENMAETVWKWYFDGRPAYSDDDWKFKKTLTNLASVGGVIEQVDRVKYTVSGPIFSAIYNYTPSYLPSFYSFYRSVGSESKWFPGYLKVHITSIIDLLYRIVLQPLPFEYGISHGDDLFMLWNINGQSSFFMSPEDLKFSQFFVDLIVNHVYGIQEAPHMEVITNHRKYVLLDNSRQLKTMLNPYESEIRFWRSIGIANFN